MEDPGLRPIPDKLRRLRTVRDSLRQAHRQATDRRDQILEKLRSVQSVVDDISSRPRAYLEMEQQEADSELQKAKRELERLQAMKEDALAQIEEISADLRPIRATCNSLEKHLGIGRADEFLPEGFQSLGMDSRSINLGSEAES
jgi:chromosome segregation ATPase